MDYSYKIRMKEVEKIQELEKELKSTDIVKLKLENSNLKIKNEFLKWKLEHPPLYKIGDKLYDRFTILGIDPENKVLRYPEKSFHIVGALAFLVLGCMGWYHKLDYKYRVFDHANKVELIIGEEKLKSWKPKEEKPKE